MILAEKSKCVDLRDAIHGAMEKLKTKHMASVQQLSNKSTSIIPDSKLTTIDNGTGSIQQISATSPSSPKGSSIVEMQKENAVEEDENDSRDGNQGKHETASMNSADFVLQYGPETMMELAYLLSHSFKVFWDGSISLYKDTVYSSTNNKEFLNKLLDIRMHSDQHQEPPVTLIHGFETEVTLRETLMRIKVEQAEELERMKQKALEQEEESEPEDDIGDLEESKEEISTFQEDMDTIADFLVSDSTPFTTKLLQGVPIPAMFSFEEHRKQSQEEQKESLDLLDLI